MPLQLKDLTTTPGVEELARALKQHGDPALIEKVRMAAQRALQRNPGLGETAVHAQPGMNNAVYNFDQKAITTGLLDPDVLGHEIGHAENTANNAAYQKLLRAVRGLAALNQTAAIPAMLGMHAFMGDEKRKDAVKTLASSKIIGPANAVMNSEDKLRTLKRVLPALGAHTVTSGLPALLYSIDGKL